jgi:hypothetical protein
MKAAVAVLVAVHCKRGIGCMQIPLVAVAKIVVWN